MNSTPDVRLLMGQIAELTKKSGFTGRVDVKVNDRGELVVAAIIPPRTPNEWGAPTAFSRREAARLARQQRG